MKRILIGTIFIGALSSCETVKNTANTNMITLTGKISELGITTFQYGTHSIKTENKTYVLKSTKVKLNAYVNKSVTLKGSKVAGYPLEGGPELIEVSEISLK